MTTSGPRPSPRPAVPALRVNPVASGDKLVTLPRRAPRAPPRPNQINPLHVRMTLRLWLPERTSCANASSKPPQCRRCRSATARAGSRVYALIMPVSFTGMTRLGRTPLHAARQSIPVHAQNRSAGYAHEPGAQFRLTAPNSARLPASRAETQPALRIPIRVHPRSSVVRLFSFLDP